MKALHVLHLLQGYCIRDTSVWTDGQDQGKLEWFLPIPFESTLSSTQPSASLSGERTGDEKLDSQPIDCRRGDTVGALDFAVEAGVQVHAETIGACTQALNLYCPNPHIWAKLIICPFPTVKSKAGGAGGG